MNPAAQKFTVTYGFKHIQIHINVYKLPNRTQDKMCYNSIDVIFLAKTDRLWCKLMNYIVLGCFFAHTHTLQPFNFVQKENPL